MNRIELMGRLACAPELSVTSDGVEVCRFRLAVNRAKSKEKTADFIPCKAWGKTAAFVNSYFGKGDMMALDGSLQCFRYDKDGETRTFYEVRVDSVYFCGSKKDKEQEAAGTQPEELDDLPF